MRIFIDLVDPFLYVIERHFICDAIGQNNPDCSLVVSLCDVFKSLLASCVPNLQLYSLIFHVYGLDLEVDPDRSHIVFLELTITESHEDVGFTDTAVPNNYELDEHIEIVFVFSTHLAHYIILIDLKARGKEAHQQHLRVVWTGASEDWPSFIF